MEYVLIFIFEILGISLNVMQNVIKIGDNHPTMNKKDIFAEIWNQDWDTLIVSLIIIVINLFVHYVLYYIDAPVIKIEYYFLYSVVIALLVGYSGQRLAYKLLGSAEKAIDKKVLDKLN
jgi:hypothetical protein